tara:strand:+ start:8043 stop:10268 length:2226 start_codon:yes stop_codon:yes gene_type:complete
MNLVKESLAKLLAQEDLIVEHRAVHTAQFDVARRVLTLPNWSHEKSVVIDLLIAHEVAHALYTPNDWSWKEEGVNHSMVNVVEDIRIEKLMKRRYEGLPKTFFKGYEILSAEDFFEVQGADLSALNLADKLNIFFKIGNFVDVPFTVEEEIYRQRALQLETWEDTIALAKDLHAFCKAQLDEQRKQHEEAKAEIEQNGDASNTEEVDAMNDPFQDSEEQESEAQPDQDAPSSPDAKESDNNEPSSEQQQDAPTGTQAGRNTGEVDALPQEPTAKTDDKLQEKLSDLINTEACEKIYVELPKSIDANTIVSNDEVSKLVEDFYIKREEFANQKDFADEYDLRLAREVIESMKQVDIEYKQFKISNQKEVNYLVKEFECKKAADGYARQTTSRTGVLDTKNLHTYKYNDDLFKKITTIPDAKNHGLIFNVDWSGSMHHQILATIKQVLTLVSFCRKVGIAYDVYLFTDAYAKYTEDYEERAELENKIIVKNFNMVNILTSSSNNRTHEKQAKNLFRIVSSFKSYQWSHGFPRKLNLGGTPLNEAMVSLNYILPSFQKRSKAQKVHVITLTDGEGSGIGYGKKVRNHFDTDDKVFSSRITPETVLRDRQTGKMYSFKDKNGVYSYYDQTHAFVYQLRDRFKGCEFINIRLIAGNDWSRFKWQCLGDNHTAKAEADAIWRKTKAFICTSSFWNVQYALSVKALSNEVEFEPKSDSKADIKRAFTKSLGAKQMNKKILSSFIERIA